MEKIAVILALLFFGNCVVFLVGLINPLKFLPKCLASNKKVSEHPRSFWVAAFILLEFFILIITPVSERENTSKPNRAYEEEMSDSLMVQKFKYQFDSLYAVVSNSPIDKDALLSIATTENEILNLLANQWIEKINSLDSLTRQLYLKDYEISCKKFDEKFPMLLLYKYALLKTQIETNGSIDSSPHKEMQVFLWEDFERITNLMDANKNLFPISREKINSLKKEYDILLSKALKTKFISLYDELIGLDKGEPSMKDRKDLHKIINNYIYEDWWNLMEKLDSTRSILPKCRKEYKDACYKYDKQYTRFSVYGDEDRYNIQDWTEYEAKRVLRKFLHDPASLEIANVKLLGKVKKGWKTAVTYRAKNMFGAYVLDQVYLIMAYDMDSGNYKCVDIR